MAFEPSFLEEQQARLMKEKERLEGELRRFAQPSDQQGGFATRMENLGDDEEENALEVEDYVDNLGVEATLEKELKDVLDALQKMDAGTYGICEETGREIAVERLMVYPAARTAI